MNGANKLNRSISTTY